MRRRQPRELLSERSALLVAVGWVCLVLVVDVASGRDIVLIGLLIVAPLLSGLTLQPRTAGLVGACVVVIAAASWAWNDTWGHWTFWVPLTVVSTGSVFAVVMASYRRRLVIDERRMAVLAAIAEVAACGILDSEEVAERIVSILVPDIVDLAIVDRIHDGVPRRLAGAYSGDLQALDALMQRPPSSSSSSGAAAAADASELSTQHLALIDDAVRRRLAHDDEDFALLKRLALTSAVLVPLVARGRPIGVLSLATRGSRPRIEAQDDVEYAELLAGRVSLALDNALLSAELASTEQQLEAILANIDAAVTVRHVDGRMVYANQAAADLLGLPDPAAVKAESPGALMAQFDVSDEAGCPVALEDLPGSRLLAGDRQPAPLLVRNVVKATGVERWLLNRASPVCDRQGDVLMAVNLVEDVTATKRSEIGQRLLAQTARAVAQAVDLHSTLHAIADAAVPAFADWAGVDLVDPRGRIVTVAIAHRDPGKVRLGWQLRRRWPSSADADAGIAAVIRDGEPQLLEHISDDMLVAGAQDDEHLAVLRAVGLNSTMIVPISAGTRLLGALSFVSSSSRRFDQRDLQLACDLGRQAGIFINNARLHDEQVHIAATLQAGLLPDALPPLPGWTTDTAYRAAGAANEVGGDFYDLVSFEGGWAAVIGDVVGKGAEAAVLTALARHTLAAIIESTGDPLHALRVLNRRLRERGTSYSSLCTISAVWVRGSHAKVICAGHPLPLLIRDGDVRQVGQISPMLGVLDDLVLHADDLDLAPGDRVVLYTDGVLDAVGEENRFGEERLLTVTRDLAARGAGHFVDQLLAAVDEFAHGEQSDDIAIMSVARTAASVPAVP